MKKKLIAIVGYPGTNKTFISSMFAGISDFEVIKWGKTIIPFISDKNGLISINAVDLAFRCEFKNPLYLVHKVISNQLIQNQAEYLLIDGMKSVEQIQAISSFLNRQPVVIKTYKEEAERIKNISHRQQFDDYDDTRRIKLLKMLGIERLLSQASFEINTTGVRIYRDKEIKLSKYQITKNFISDVDKVLKFLAISKNIGQSSDIIFNAYINEAKRTNFELSINIC